VSFVPDYKSRGAMRLAEDFESADGGGVASFNTEFLEDVTHVLFDRFFAHPKDDGDVSIALALSDPEENFGFTWSEAECVLQGFVGAEVGTESTDGCGGLFDPRFDRLGFGQSCLDGGQKILANDRFGEVVVGPMIHSNADVGFVASGGKENEGDGCGERIGAERLDDTIAIKLGHHDIAEDEVGWILANQFESEEAIGCALHFITFKLQHESEVTTHGRLILDDDDVFHGRGLFCGIHDNGRRHTVPSDQSRSAERKCVE
jgi:hypothetical protein